MLQAVLFDLDDTLYDYESCNHIAMTNLCLFAQENLGISGDDFIQVFKKGKQIVKNNIGTQYASAHNRILYMQKVLELLGENPLKYSIPMYNIYWNSILKHMTLQAGALEFILQLKKQKIKTGICTNLTANIQFQKIAKLGLEDYMDALVTSEEAGAEKPDPIIFHMCMKKLNVLSSECIYIGDSYENDVCGAQKAGIRAVLLNNPVKRKDCLQFSSFHELSNHFTKIEMLLSDLEERR